MIQAADLVASLRGSDEGFASTMDVAGRAVEGLHHNTDSALGSVKALGLGLGALSAGALVSAVKQASDFSTMMVHVQSNTGVTNAELATMSAGIKQLAAGSGAPLDQLSEGFMRIHNSGFSAADALKILTPAMQSALSTGDDTGKVAQALGVAMHEFHIQAAQATQTMNLLHTAAQLGNSTLGEFADGTTKALNLAGGFGLSLTEVAAALSTLTQSGQTARNASDGLSSVMSGFVKPTTGAMTVVSALSKATGVDLVRDFSAAGFSSRGLVNSIDDVKLALSKMGPETDAQRQILTDYANQLTATGNISDAQFSAKMTVMAKKIHDPTAALLQLFPNIRAFREMMLLTGSQAGSFAQNLSTLSDVASGKLDPTLKGFQAQQATLAAQMAKLQTNVQILAINLGTVLLPPLTALVSQVTPIVQRFADWAGQNQSLVIGVLAAGVAIGVLTVAAIGLGAAVEVATGPIGLLAAAGAGLYLAWQHNLGGIQGIVAGMWANVKPVLTEMQAAFAAGGVSGLAGKIQSSLAGIDWAGLGQTIARNVQQWGAALVGWVAPRLPAVVAALGDLASRVVTYIRAAAPVIAGQMQAWGQAVWTWIQQATPRVVAQLQTWGAALVAWVQPQIGPLVATLGGLLSRLGSWIVGDALPVVVARLESWGSAFVGWIGPKIGPMLAAAGDLLGRLGNWMQATALPAIRDKLAEWGSELVAWVSPRIGPLMTAAGNLLGQFGNWITGTALPQIGQKLTQWGDAFTAWIVPATVRLLNDWPGHLNSFLDVVQAAVPKIVAKLADWAGAFVGWIQANNVVPKLATAFVAVNLAIIDFIGTTVGTIAIRLLKWANAFADWVVPSIKLLGPSLNLFWDALKKWIDNTAKDTGAKMVQFGKDAVQGFIDGLKAKAGDLKNAAEGIPGAVLSAVKDKLKIFSPSQVMHGVGSDTMTGYINGLVAKRDDAASAAGGVARAVLAGFTGTLMAGIGTVDATMVSIATAASDVFNQAMAKAGYAAGQTFGLSFGNYFNQGNTKVQEGELQIPIDKYSAQGSITPGKGGSPSEVAQAIVAAHTAAVAAALPSVQAAHAGLARAAVAALAGGITGGAGAIAAATTAAMSQAAQAARAQLAEWTAVSAEAAQRLKNLATTGNTSGVVAGTQASAALHVDQSGIAPVVSAAAASQARAQFDAIMAAQRTVAQQSQQQITTTAQLQLTYKDLHLRYLDQIKAAQDAGNTELVNQLKVQDATLTDNYKHALIQLQQYANALKDLHTQTMGQIDQEAKARASSLADLAANGGPAAPSVTAASLVGGGVLSPLQQAIADATKVAPQAMHDYGVLMANLLAAGLAQGLGEQGAITYALSTLSKGMQGQISQDWQMHSPSRVAEAYGRNIVAGLVGGIRASQADARAVLGGLFTPVSGSAGGAGSGRGGDVHVTVNVSGDSVSVAGADHHGLAKALGDHAQAFLQAARTTAPPRDRLLPGAIATVPH